MTHRTIAPHLVGRMLLALFSCMPDFKTPRFPGDPWSTFPHAPTVHWMHATECTFGAGSVTSKRFEPHWREVLRPAPVQVELFAEELS